ncbi:hypothetical protein [Streptomyces sp. AC495_CC817]|uniref:hypothetical protein n=1 Tax=Streptomyces sp. AC495_CC817 TaxID=2823900 RepID=UPI001C2794F6|nr:hypothetical protein [Streptomyces sp. AC495_CC817]
MSDPRAIPDEERPFIPEELVPRQKSDDPIGPDPGSDEPEDEDDGDGDEEVRIEDLP